MIVSKESQAHILLGTKKQANLYGELEKKNVPDSWLLLWGNLSALGTRVGLNCRYSVTGKASFEFYLVLKRSLGCEFRKVFGENILKPFKQIDKSCVVTWDAILLDFLDDFDAISG